MLPNLFILGAGFTKAVFPKAPLNDSLLTAVVGSSPDESPLGRIWSRYGSTNIETLLTQFDLELSSRGGTFTSEERADVSAQLARFVEQFRFQGDVPWLEPLLQTLSNNDVILSLNYDCLIEGFLDFHHMWSPRGGYDLIRHPMDDSLPLNDRNIRILKVHGSENFRLSPVYDKREWAVVGLEINSSLFPRSGKNRNFGGGLDGVPHLIAPSFTKQFGVELQHFLLEAIRSARVARNLVIIGCGLRWEDSHLWLVLTNFMKCSRWKRKRTIVVDPNASELSERISRFWCRDVFTESSLVPIDSGLQEALPRLRDLLR